MSATFKEKINSTIKGYGKKIFVGYLALITGCTSPLQNIEHASTVENKNTHSNSGNNYNTTHNQKTSALAVNKYNLPSLDLKNESLVTTKEKSNPLFEGVGANAVEQPIANPRNTAQKSQDGSDLQALAMGMASSEGSEAVKNWFAAKHATAELSLGVAENGVKSGSLDVLMPLYDTKNDLLFTQLGFRRSNQFSEDYRNTVNIGAGYRHTTDNRWILGANSFYDRDLTGKNDRLGLGLEAMTDYLKVSGNSYIRLSDWKQSPDMDYFQERPANGWDLRTEAYLPQYPQLGGKLMYEQYYGEEVGLFGASNRQKDPSATTVGLSYTPIPLISLSTDYRQGENGLSETSFKIGFNLQLGVPLKKQLSADELRASRLIEHSRYDLVDRRNDIVLDFKENEKGSIALPIQLKGSANEIINFPVNISGPVRNITWEGTAASYAMVYGGGPTASIKLPSYNTAGTNFYTLKAIATDSSGRVVESNYMQIAVESIKIILETSKTTATADGNDFILFTATLTKATGEIIPNADVNWNIQGSATVLQKDIKTNTSGKAILKLSSLTSSTVDVSVGETGGVSTNIQGNFVADSTTAKVTNVIAENTSTVADGNTYTTLTATVTDLSGNKVGAGITVSWSTNLGTLSNTSSITDANGKAIITLKSSTAGVATVTATTPKGSSNTQITYTSNVSTSKVVSVLTSIASIVSDGNDTATITALVEDTNGNPVPAGVVVNWATNIGSLEKTSSTTDATGHAINKFKSMRSGVATISASSIAGSATTQINVIADTNSFKVIGVGSSLPQATANGTQTVQLIAVVQDVNGNNAPAGTTVNWTTSIGNLGTVTSVTNANGEAINTITSTMAGVANITAVTSSTPKSGTVVFIADSTTAKVLSVISTPSIVLANGIVTSTIEAKIVDANNNVLGAGNSVNWNASIGTLSSNTSVTNNTGSAFVTIKSTVVGTSTITATSGTSNQTTTVTFTLDSTTAQISSLTESKTTIKANGSDIAVLTAIVKDINNNPIPNATVNWTTTSGVLSATSTVTNSSGEAIVNFTDTITGTATITAAILNSTLSKNVIVEADTTTAKVTTVTTSATSTVADGTTIVNLEAIVKDNNNNPLGAGITVNWNTNIGTLGSATSVTDAQGKAINTLKSNVVGTATVNANSTSGGNSVSVNFTIAPTVSVVSVTATPTAIPADGTTKTTLVAVVHDQNNVPVNSGVAVTWSTTNGTLSTNSSVTDNSGNATVTLLGNLAGTATVTASATNGSSNTVVTFNTVAVYHVDSLNSNPSEALADGIEFVTVTAQILDQNNQPAPAGVPITWTTTLGTIVNANTVTDSAGKTSAQFKSTVSGNATITTTNASFSSSINFKPLPSGFVVSVLTASPTTIPADNIAETIITATIVDKDGNQVPDGTTVTWNANNGTLSQNSTVTSGGKTTNDYKTGIDGTSVIQVTPQNGVGKTISIVASEVSYVISTLSASPTTIRGDGIEYTTVTATLKDLNGNPASAGRTVYFSSDFGMPELFSSSVANTDSTGKATVTFKSDIPAQGIYLYAGLSNNDRSEGTPINITETNTYQINSITSSAQDISSDGNEEIEIEISVTDENSNIPPVNTKIFVNAQYGILSSRTIYTDSNGIAKVKYKTNHTGVDGIYATVSGSQMGNGIMIQGVERNTNNGTIRIVNHSEDKLYDQESGILRIRIQTAIPDTTGINNANIRFECLSGVCMDTNGNSILKEFEATTNSSGYAEVVFGPSSNYGTAIFRATYVDDPSLYINIVVEVVSYGPPM